MSAQKLPLCDIEVFAGTQARAHTDNEVVADYADRMKEGDVFPPIIVFNNGDHLYLADGFHRVLASENCMFLDIEADVREGSLQDAIWYALGANKANGQRLSPGDKAHAIELALKQFPEKSQEEIATQIGCSQSYVSSVRKDNISSDNISVPKERTDSIGRTRPTSYSTKKVEPLRLPAPAENPMPINRPMGLFIVGVVIAGHLNRIKDDDEELEAGLQMLEEWIAKRRVRS